MARIFSITFQYNDFPEHALVLVHETPHFTEYKISPMNDKLRDLLPCDKLISHSPNEFSCAGDTTCVEFNGVMKEIVEAICEHLPAVPHS